MAREILQVAGAVIGQYFGGPIGAQIGYQIGNAIGSAIDPLEFQGPKLGDAAVQTSRDGIPIPIGWGITHVVGNIVQINPIVTSKIKTGDKKSGKVVTERHSRTFAIGIGRSIDGPIGGLVRVWENNKLVYDVRGGTTFPSADNTAFEAATTLYLGTETQLPDSELESHTGVGNTPAYRALAYIVFNNKDITNFGSSIPSYRFEIWASRTFQSASGIGYSYTQYQYQPAPHFQHPFRNQIYNEFTISAIFSPQSLPINTEDTNIFRIMRDGDAIGMLARKRPISNQVYFQAALASYDAGNPTSDSVGVHTFELTIDHPTWLITDWYWMALSYDSVGGSFKAALRNLTQGGEEITDVSIVSQVPIEFSTMLLLASFCIWGSDRSNESTIAMAMSQLVIHDVYIDLSVLANRNKFCCPNGIINIGSQGEKIFGEVPLVHSPRGFPQEANGTIFIGDTSDLHELTEIDRPAIFPPTGVC